MVASIAALLGTGRDPGSPRQTGQTWGLGSAPNSVGQPQNILVRVPSSTCVSSPITGSYRAVTSSTVTAGITRSLLAVWPAGRRGWLLGQNPAGDGGSGRPWGEG